MSKLTLVAHKSHSIREDEVIDEVFCHEYYILFLPYLLSQFLLLLINVPSLIVK